MSRGKYIQKIRKDNRLDRTKLVENIMHEQTLRKFEIGDTDDMYFENILKLVYLLDVGLDEFVFITNNYINQSQIVDKDRYRNLMFEAVSNSNSEKLEEILNELNVVDDVNNNLYFKQVIFFIKAFTGKIDDSYINEIYDHLMDLEIFCIHDYKTLGNLTTYLTKDKIINLWDKMSEHYFKFLDFQKLNEGQEDFPVIFFNIISRYIDFGLEDEAEKMFRKAEIIFRNSNYKTKVFMKTTEARILCIAGDIEKGKEIYRECIKIFNFFEEKEYSEKFEYELNSFENKNGRGFWL